MNKTSELIKQTVFEIKEADFATVGDFWKNIVFFYKHDRFYYVTEGEANLILKDKVISLKKNFLYYIPSYSVVTANCDSLLSHHFIHFQFSDMYNNLYNAINLRNEAPAEPYDESLFKRIEELIKSDDKAGYKDLEINGLLQVILSRFIPKTDDVLMPLRFGEVIDYINKNVEKRITLQELADLCHLHKVYFSNTFKAQFGISPSQYVINKKMQRAMLLLRDSDKTVMEISDQLGYDNELYFSRIFHLKTGFTPSEFRKKMKRPHRQS